MTRHGKTTGVLALIMLAACASPASRIKKHSAQFAAYPPETQARIKAGEVDTGFDADMVRMALGKPSRTSTRTTTASSQEVWAYDDPSTSSGLGIGIGAGNFGGFGGGVAVGSGSSTRERARVIFEAGKVVAVERLKN